MTITGAYNLLVTHVKQRGDLKNTGNDIQSGIHQTKNEEVSFANIQNIQKCYVCGDKSHLAPACPNCHDNKKDEKQLTALIRAVEEESISNESSVFANVSNKRNEKVTSHQTSWIVDQNWVLLDSESMSDIFCNPKLVKDI